MKKEDFDELLDRYLKGEVSPREEKWFDAFFLSYQKGEVNHDFSESQRTKLEIYQRVRQHIQQEDTVNRPAKALWPVWLKIAAMLVVVAGLSWLIIGNPTVKEEVKFISKSTERGQKSTLVLPDGTKVRLNAESTLSYPEKFDNNSREVTLTGEGFFEVTKNPEQPFIVHAPGFSTKVLGTAFNVSAYAENEPTVTVQEGRVEVRLKEDTTSSVILTMNEQAGLADGKLSKKQVDIVRFISWKDNVIYLDETTLGEMAVVLERWYNVKITFENPEVRNCTISGKFSNDQLINILKSVQFVKGIDFTFTDDQTIVLSGKPC